MLTAVRVLRFLRDISGCRQPKDARTNVVAFQAMFALRIGERRIDLIHHPQKHYPVLRGLITTPTLRADGTLLYKPGYTGLYFDPQGVDFGKPPRKPTKEDAEAALQRMEALIRDFPFVPDASGNGLKSSSSSVAVACILTGPIRPTLKNAPLIGYTAPKARTGKSKLNDIGSMIERGHEAAVINASDDSIEFEKQLTAVIACGSTLVTFDNLNGVLESKLHCFARCSRKKPPRCASLVTTRKHSLIHVLRSSL